MSDAYFFGYGSLVNRDTQDYPGCVPARLNGWRRVWRHTTLRPIALLTAEPAELVAIDGVIARVPGQDWAALDTREFAYHRVAVATGALEHPAQPSDLAVYEIPEDKHPTSAKALPVLLSYLDVVVQGFHREFGVEGVADFFATTEGWDGGILDDRTNPQYPRNQKLSTEETALVDRHIADMGLPLHRYSGQFVL